MPAFGISLAYTVATTYLPVLIERLSGPAITGVLIGAEGVFALTLPIIVGVYSDRLRTRIGGRMPFILAAGALAVLALAVMGFSGGSLVALVIALAAFFAAYFAYQAPYYALFPDLVPEKMRGRSQGAAGGFRSAGMLLMLLGGGLLLDLWRPLPFLVGAVLIGGVTVFFFYGVRYRTGGEGEQQEKGSGPGRAGWRENWELVRDNPNIRVWISANAMWEAAVGALRVFVVLYLTEGLGLSLSASSGVLALVGVAAIAAAPSSGWLADRFGHRPVMVASAAFFGLGLLPTLFTTNTLWLIAIVPGAFAAVILITLPYSVLMGFLPEGTQHGIGAALFSASRGFGIVLGVVLAGVAVEFFRGFDIGLLVFAETGGYAAIFPVASIFLLGSIPLLFKMDVDNRGGV